MKYTIINTKETKSVMHDATRPFLVVAAYYNGYRHGMRRMLIGRYTTKKGAKAAIKRFEAR